MTMLSNCVGDSVSVEARKGRVAYREASSAALKKGKGKWPARGSPAAGVCPWHCT